MKIKIDTQKSAEVVSSILQKTSDTGKKAVAEIQKGATLLSERAKQDNYLRRMRKYNPLFLDEYQSAEFFIPNMIVIVDDAVRRGIDVCEGSIGWRGNVNGMEVFYLYDEAVAVSGLQFVPVATCDAVYYVDSFDRRRYIRTDCIFNKAHEERLAELKSIAHALGAKSCSIEISESTHQFSKTSKKISISEGLNFKGLSASSKESSEQLSTNQNNNQRSGRIVAEFEGSTEPHLPSLKWFAHDDNIKKLIEIRCSGDNSIKSETLELSGASSATMSQKTACSIDGAVSKISNIHGSASMEAQAITENSSKLIYKIEF